MATTRPHLGPLLAVAALSAATALGLTRVFAHAAWLAPMLVAAIMPVVITACAVVYRWSACAFAIAVFYGGMWWSAFVVFPDRTVLKIVPTPPGLGVWLRGILDAPHVLRTAVVPVPPLGHALELALLALWMATAGVAWSAVKHDGVLIALLPHFALFIAIASLGKGPYVVTTTLWCAAAGAFLLVQHADSVLRARTGFQAATAHRSRLLSGGAFAAVCALVFGALVGPRLPDAGSAPLLDYKGLGHGDGATQIVDISPLVGIRDKLNQPKPTALFEVTSTNEARWRLMALDDFDGSYWGLRETATTSSLPPIGPATLPGVRHETVGQAYAIGPMAGKFLPAAYQAFGAPDLSNLVVIPDSATLVVPDENHNGLHYAVSSALLGASPATLRVAPPVDSRDPLEARNLELPASFSPRVRAEAERIVQGATTEYDKARRLQDYFRDPKRFRYDQGVDLSESTNAMVDFLFSVRRGFCEQFAGTYAAMARAIGLPTRVAVGFQPGNPVRQGVNADDSEVTTYSVTTREAHAWPEVYFPHVGWVAFEPTPGRYDYDSPGDPSGTRAGAPPYSPGGPQAGSSTTTVVPTTVASNNGSTPGRSPNLPDRLQINPPGSTSPSRRSRADQTNLWLLVPAILLGALAATVGLIMLLRRARRWRRATRRRHALASTARGRRPARTSRAVTSAGARRPRWWSSRCARRLRRAPVPRGRRCSSSRSSKPAPCTRSTSPPTPTRRGRGSAPARSGRPCGPRPRAASGSASTSGSPGGADSRPPQRREGRDRAVNAPARGALPRMWPDRG